ncbi:putative C2H2-type domain-containing protein [Seiridium cardinale]
MADRGEPMASGPKGRGKSSVKQEIEDHRLSGCQTASLDRSILFQQLNVGHNPEPEDRQWDEESLNSSYPDIEDDYSLDKILDYTLETFPRLQEGGLPPIWNLRPLVRELVAELAQAKPTGIFRSVTQRSHTSTESGQTSASDGTSSIQTSTNNNQVRNGKRRSAQDGNHNNQDDEDGDMGRKRNGPSKRRMTVSNGSAPGRQLFTCPFRCKDPKLFNIRDHPECARKVFDASKGEIAELRRHIIKKHSWEGVRLFDAPFFHCDTCKDVFKEHEFEKKESHVKAGACEFKDYPCSANPLDGIDFTTYQALKNRRGRLGNSPEDQYKGIWRLVFRGEKPDLGAGEWHLPLVEQFELQEEYIGSIEPLCEKLQTLALREFDPVQLNDLIRLHFKTTVDQCLQRTLGPSSAWQPPVMPKDNRIRNRQPHDSALGLLSDDVPSLEQPAYEPVVEMSTGRLDEVSHQHHDQGAMPGGTYSIDTPSGLYETLEMHRPSNGKPPALFDAWGNVVPVAANRTDDIWVPLLTDDWSTQPEPYTTIPSEYPTAQHEIYNTDAYDYNALSDIPLPRVPPGTMQHGGTQSYHRQSGQMEFSNTAYHSMASDTWSHAPRQ